MKMLYSFPLSLNKHQGNWEKIFKQNNSVNSIPQYYLHSIRCDYEHLIIPFQLQFYVHILFKYLPIFLKKIFQTYICDLSTDFSYLFYFGEFQL